MNIEILYSDAHILVVRKIAGLLSQADDTGDPDLFNCLKGQLGLDRFLGLMHRLDRPVSGLMVFALSRSAASNLADQFRQRLVIKNYMAIVAGTLSGEGQWFDYLAMGRRARVVTATDPKAKEAILNWRAIASEQGMTLLDINLKTGRPHQIRIQCASRGHGIVGDSRYKSKLSFGAPSIALHSWYLAFSHPITSLPQSWRLPAPAAWHGYFDVQRADLLRGLPQK